MQVPEARCLIKMINGVRVVAAPAEVDITSAEEFRAVLLTAAEAGRQGGRQVVVVDMTHTVFCDSSLAEALAPAPASAVRHSQER